MCFASDRNLMWANLCGNNTPLRKIPKLLQNALQIEALQFGLGSKFIQETRCPIGHWVGTYGTLGRTATTTGASKKHYWIAQLPFIPTYCKLPVHMHDKVLVVDGFMFWFSSRILFRGQNLPNFRKRGAKVSEGCTHHPVEESQASNSIILCDY